MSRSGGLFRAALLAPANLLGLTGAAAGAAWSHSPTAALVAAGLEAVYLGGALLSVPFRRALRQDRQARSAERELQDALATLAPSQREQVEALRALRDGMGANFRRLPGGEGLARSSEERVDALLASFVRLLAALNQHRRYLSTLDRVSMERERQALAAEVAREESPRLKEVKQRRLEILERREAHFRQGLEARELMSHQLASIEDLLRLTHEQSLALRDPAGVGHQLEALTTEVQATEETLRELAPLWQLEEPRPTPLPTSTGRVRSPT